MRRVVRLWPGSLAALALVPFTLWAHPEVATRTLRLQLQGAVLQGLLQVELPPGPLSAVPVGQALGERPGEDLETALGLRLASVGLQGLNLRVVQPVAKDVGVPAQRALELLEARGRRTKSGGLQGRLLLRGPEVEPGRVLAISVESGLPLTIELYATTGELLELRSGLGKELAGGLSLSPRPGAPVLVYVSRVKPPSATPAPGAKDSPR